MAGTYRVKSGDSLSKIAKNVYKDVSLWPEIAKANKLGPPYKIYAGQELIVPNSSQVGTLLSTGTGMPHVTVPVTLTRFSPSRNLQ